MNIWSHRLLASGLLTSGLAFVLSTGVLAQQQQDEGEQVAVTMRAVNLNGVGESIGRIVVTEHEGGLIFSPELTGLQPGLHGFHIHENPDCGPGPMEGGGRGPAKAAGSHWDPENTDRHAAPWEDGHRGDLPALHVNDKRLGQHPVYKPDIELADLSGRALIIHHGGDNYQSEPDPRGGGGPAAACGIIEEVG